MVDYFQAVFDKYQHRVEISSAQYYLFSCFEIIYFGLPFQKSPSSIFLHTSAAALSFILIFKDSWPEKIKPLFPLYWYIVLTYCLSFASTFMMFKGIISFPWFFLSIFLLSILVNWISFTIIMFVGFFTTILLLSLNGNGIYIPSNAPDQTFTAYTCVFAILITSLFLRNRDRTLNERLKAYQDLSGYIAHEMRKPLAFIRTSCEGWEKYSPQLFEAYEVAIKSGAYKNEINPLAFNILREIPREFKKTSSDGLLFIEMLLMQTQHSFETGKNFQFDYALNNINTAIHRWGLGTDRIAKINLKTEYNFRYYGIPILLNHVLLELFRNSEYFISNRKDSQIDIWCSRSGVNNEIHFMDNGCGINNDDLKDVFKNGFSKRTYGTGLGLGFCKMVMKQMEGSIRILSKNGSYTEIVLSFPVLRGGMEDVV
jgi:signal transduction histidine kinase